MISKFLEKEMELSYLSDLKKELLYLELIRKNGLTKENLINIIKFNDERGKNISLFDVMSLRYPNKEISHYHLNTHMMPHQDGDVELFIEPYFGDAPMNFYKTWVNTLDKYGSLLLEAYNEYFGYKYGYEYSYIYITDPRGLY